MNADNAIYSESRPPTPAVFPPGRASDRRPWTSRQTRRLLDLVLTLKPDDEPGTEFLSATEPALLVIHDEGAGPSALDHTSLASALGRCSAVLVTDDAETDVRPLLAMTGRRKRPVAIVRTELARYREWMAIVEVSLAPCWVAETIEDEL